jgi:heme A synthase
MRNRGFERLAWATLAYTVAVVLWGAIVRATGSGAGCGESWPLCNGQLVFGTPALAKAIELAHRMSSGLLGTLIAFMAVWVFRAFKQGHPARAAAGACVPFLIVEALLGAALVKYGLVVNDPSPARAFVLSLHMANTLALVGAVALTAWWGSGHPRVRWDRSAWISLSGVVLVGVTGTLSALADTLFPSPSLEAGLAADWSAGANWLIHLRGLHPLLALAVGLWAIVYAWGRIARAERLAHSQRLAAAVIALVCAQIAAGVLNLALLTPLGMQITHLLLADLLWIALLLLTESPIVRAPTSPRL